MRKQLLGGKIKVGSLWPWKESKVHIKEPPQHSFRRVKIPCRIWDDLSEGETTISPLAASLVSSRPVGPSSWESLGELDPYPWKLYTTCEFDKDISLSGNFWRQEAYMSSWRQKAKKVLWPSWKGLSTSSPSSENCKGEAESLQPHRQRAPSVEETRSKPRWWPSSHLSSSVLSSLARKISTPPPPPIPNTMAIRPWKPVGVEMIISSKSPSF